MEACRKFYGRAIERRKKGSLWKVPPFPPSHSFHRRLRPLASSIPNTVTLWFEPALEFPNDYLEMERLGFEVGEKMLRVSPLSSDARSDTRII
jgi:hypothetical protein